MLLFLESEIIPGLDFLTNILFCCSGLSNSFPGKSNHHCHVSAYEKSFPIKSVPSPSWSGSCRRNLLSPKKTQRRHVSTAEEVRKTCNKSYSENFCLHSAISPLQFRCLLTIPFFSMVFLSYPFWLLLSVLKKMKRYFSVGLYCFSYHLLFLLDNRLNLHYCLNTSHTSN